MNALHEWLRCLPAVNELLNHPRLAAIKERTNPPLFLKAVRALVDEEREKILTQEMKEGYQFDYSSLASEVEEKIRSLTLPHLRKVINATGVILHTNLGRAPLAEKTLAHLAQVSSSYCNLELDLKTGQRGSRFAHVEDLLCQLSGAEAALVVNNNAAAVLLALNTLALGGQVVVSRGELVEIGGSFRLPDVMKRSGATLIEVGTTNRTYLSDYEGAITSSTRILLKVHTSNFRVLGFTCEVPLAELVGLGKRYSLPVMWDLGSGCLVDLAPLGVGQEPTVPSAVQAGASLVTFSGDKLLGGPQAGILVGKKEYVAAASKNPLSRALRIDKMTLAALEATLRLYLEEDPLKQVPALRLLTLSLKEIEKKAKRLLRLLKEARDTSLKVVLKQDLSQVGGGALPLQDLPTWALAVTHEQLSPSLLEQRLREAEPPVIARVHENQLILDMRSVLPEEIPLVARALLHDSSSSVKTISR